jgi:hypothetical protein
MKPIQQIIEGLQLGRSSCDPRLAARVLGRMLIRAGGYRPVLALRGRLPRQ